MRAYSPELKSYRHAVDEQVKRLDEMLLLYQQQMDRRFDHSDNEHKNGRRELRRFEKDIKQQLKKMNELRGALSDLGKLMATRRDLESAVETLKAERQSLYQNLIGQLSDYGRRIGELEKNVAVGPAGLKTLQGIADQSVGAERQAHRISASVVAWAAVGAVFLSVLVGVLVKFA
jgi:predicted  nucleic acid-binding Zn-ribbon protein